MVLSLHLTIVGALYALIVSLNSLWEIFFLFRDFFFFFLCRPFFKVCIEFVTLSVVVVVVSLLIHVRLLRSDGQ